MVSTGLFVGLITLDFIYLTETLPAPNQKIVALDYAIAAGGPATNAAVAFQHLGSSAQLLGVVGADPLSAIVRADLHQCQVRVMDLMPDRAAPLPTSSILVTQATGERAVVSLNATRAQAEIGAIPAEVLQGIEVVLVDGHQMAVGQALAQQAQQRSIPVVVDGGSWKPGFEQVLAYTDYALCSAHFRPPGCQTLGDGLQYLRRQGIPHIVITQGEQPLLVCQGESMREIPVPQITAVDTLGAGDIFHGAFCHYILHMGFEAALEQSAVVAARSCQFFGTRQWMQP